MKMMIDWMNKWIIIKKKHTKYTFHKYLLIMSFFRSKPMKYYSIVIPRESAWVVMD